MRDSKRNTDVKNSLLDSVGEGEGGMIWEGSIETCILSYVKLIASPGSMHEAGAHVHPWLIHVDVWQKPQQYCKVIILQLKVIH